MDINHYPPKSFNLKNMDLLAQEIFKSSSPQAGSDCVFSASFFTTKNYPDKATLNKKLASLSQQQCVWTEERIERGEYISLAEVMVVENCIQRIKQFHEYGYNLNSLPINDKDSIIPLHGATQQGYIDSIHSLAERGIDFNAKDSNGCNAAHYAADIGQNLVIHTLAQYGTNLNEKDKNGLTPLYRAARSGNAKTVDALLQHGADVHLKTDDSLTIISAAIQSGDVETLNLLGHHYSKRNVSLTNHIDMSLSYIATVWGHMHVIEALLSYGVKLDSAEKDKLADTAVIHNSPQLIKILFNHGYDINRSSLTMGAPIIHFAANYNRFDVLLELVKLGADFNQPFIGDEDILMTWVTEENDDVMQRAESFIEGQKRIKKGAETNISMTPFDIATIMGHTSNSKLLGRAAKIKQLYKCINEFKVYGEQCLAAKGNSKKEGHVVISLAREFQELADRYLKASCAEHYAADEISEIRQDFDYFLNKGQTNEHSIAWKPFLINLAIAASLVGLLAMTVKYSLTGNAFFAHSERWYKTEAIHNALVVCF